MEGVDWIVEGGSVEGRVVEGIAVGGREVVAAAAAATPAFTSAENADEWGKEVAGDKAGVCDD